MMSVAILLGTNVLVKHELFTSLEISDSALSGGFKFQTFTSYKNKIPRNLNLEEIMLPLHTEENNDSNDRNNNNANNKENNVA